MISSNKLFAQSEKVTTITSLEEAITIGLRENGHVQSALTNIALQQQGIKSANNFGKTEFGVQYGQYNSFENDFAIQLNQSIEFPTVYTAPEKISQNVGGRQPNATFDYRESA